MIEHLNTVCYRFKSVENSWTLPVYLEHGGYAVWKEIVKTAPDPKDLIEVIKRSGLRGRGGAGFPTGLKWSFMDRNAPGPKYLICNSDEGEPGTFKDRQILTTNPHQLIEGMLIASYVMGLDVGYNFLRGEFALPFQRCESALAEARAAGLVGASILGSKLNIEIHNILGAGSYIVGEETAMIEALEGKRAYPRYKPPFPAVHGLYGQPTTVNNTETLASVPMILAQGADWFSGLGTEKSGGTKMFSVSGHVNNPGVFEIPLGTSFESLLALAGGLQEGRSCLAVIPGGTSMRVVPGAEMLTSEMSYEGMEAVGSAIGSGGLIVMDDRTDIAQALAVMMEFYQHESCGQCTPCREGSGWVSALTARLAQGLGKPGDIDRLYAIAKQIEGRTICAFGEAISWPVTSFIQHFRPQLEVGIASNESSENCT